MKCIDLFCGCGGLSLGFQYAGFEILAAIDNWKKAIDVYRDNFGHDAILQDLTDEKEAVETIKEYEADLIMGGPPCQDFSSAGNRDESLGRANLTYNFANIVCDYMPRFFVMENVERIKKSHILEKIASQFSSAGYGLTAVILNASYCQVPQARNRFFLIGELEGKNNILTNVFANNLCNKPMTIRDYFGDSLGIEYYYRHPRNYSRRGIYSIDEPSPTVRGVNRPVPTGYKKHRRDPQDADLKTVRPLTTVERSYIQTFPKTFKLKGTKTNLEQMIGNAVPVNLAKFIALGIAQYANSEAGIIHQHTLFDINDNLKIPDKALTKLLVS